MSVHEVLDESELNTVIEVLSNAFSNDPELMYLVHREKDAYPYIKKLFQYIIPYVYKNKAHILMGDNNDSSLIWWKSMEDPIGIPSFFSIMYNIRSLLDITGSWYGLHRTLMHLRITENAHPKFNHLYVFAHGVEQEHVQQGHGSALIKSLIDYADTHNYPIYLETAKESNLQFYQKHGFIVLQRIQQYDDSPCYWTMLRPITDSSQSIGTK